MAPLQVFVLPLSLKLLHQTADRFHFVARTHEHHVPSVDDHEVVHPEGHDQAGVFARLLEDERASGIESTDITTEDQIAGGIGLHDVEQPLPTSQIPPLEPIGSDEGDVLRPLHHAVVNRLLLQAIPDALQHLPLLRRAEGRLDLFQAAKEGGHLPLELREDPVGPPDKHTGIPGIPARSDVGLGRLAVRFLLERPHSEGRGSLELAPRLAAFDVAKAGRRVGGPDPQSDEISFYGQGERGPEDLLKGDDVPDVVIRRQARHPALRVAPVQRNRRQPHYGGRASGRGLDQEVVPRHFGRLRSQIVGLILGGDHPDALGREDRQNAIHRKLEQGALAEEAQRLFGPPSTGDGPKTSAPAPRHDDRMLCHDLYSTRYSAGASRARTYCIPPTCLARPFSSSMAREALTWEAGKPQRAWTSSTCTGSLVRAARTRASSSSWGSASLTASWRATASRLSASNTSSRATRGRAPERMSRLVPRLGPW